MTEPEIVVTQADIKAAALYWVGQKNRETFPEDLVYAEQNWQIIIPVRRLVEAFAAHRIAAEKRAKAQELEGALRKADDVVDQGPLIAWGKVETGPHEGGFMAIEYAGRNYYAEEVAQALSQAPAPEVVEDVREVVNDNDKPLEVSVNGDALLQALGRAWEQFKELGGENMDRDDFAQYAMDALHDPKLAPFFSEGG